MPETETYRRCLVKSPMQFRWEESPIPARPEKDYLVRVEVCGLCRSDLHFATSWARDWDHLGHEFGGTVVAVRDGMDRFKIGDRVAVRNASACGECVACRAGNERACRGLVVNKQGFSQFADCDERSLVSARGLNDDRLSLVEPTNVVLDLIHAAGIDEARRVLILGAGTLGLLAAYLLREHFGFADVAVAARSAESPFAARLGVPYLSLDEVAAKTPVSSLLGGAPDRVLVTTPPSTLQAALEACAPGGRVLTVGFDRNEALEARIDIMTLIFRRATIEGVFACPNLHFGEAVDILERLGGPLEQLIERRIPLDDLEALMRAWPAREHFDGKSILLLHGSKEAMACSR